MFLETKAGQNGTYQEESVLARCEQAKHCPMHYPPVHSFGSGARGFEGGRWTLPFKSQVVVVVVVWWW